MSRCLITRRAQHDLLAIWLYVAEDSIDYADGLVQRLMDEAHLIADNPKMGRERPELAAGVRGFSVDRRYLILYREIEGGIEVVHFVHGARDLHELEFDG